MCARSSYQGREEEITSHRYYGLKLPVHDDVIKWKHFPRYWPFVRGIQRSPVKSPHKGQWRGVLMSPLICAWINGWVNTHEAGDLRHYRAYYDATVMHSLYTIFCPHNVNVTSPITNRFLTIECHGERSGNAQLFSFTLIVHVLPFYENQNFI